MKNVKGEITTNTKETQRIITATLSTYIPINWKILNKFLDMYDHPKLNQEDINHLNRSITHNEIDAS
jgi:hypothetical protein